MHKKGATDRQMAGKQGLRVIIKMGGILPKIKVFTYDSDTIFTKWSICLILVTISVYYVQNAACSTLATVDCVRVTQATLPWDDKGRKLSRKTLKYHG